ncbi:MAG: two-component hybrid sensor and regulator [Steroidobacteraceae bacterium]|nr:two-component hybrid sensor and regulator [Steroidobacteraceae bacterium]
MANNERGKARGESGEDMSSRTPQPSAEHKQSLLIVDDEPASMRALCDTLEYEGYQTYGFTAPSEALAAMRERSFDLLLADLQMPGTNGIDLMKSAQLIDPTLVAVIMTGHGALETAIAAMKAGALDYIQKPIKLATTLPVLERALAVRQLRVEKKRLEANVRERTEELKIANRELEAFSYSVSHDLRAPLRAVSVFTQALLSDHTGHLNDEGRRLLQNVNAGAAHMDRLITDLLRLSQLNRQPLHKQPTRFGDLARKVIDDMAHERSGRQIEFVIADFPTWQVDQGLMQQVFVNLISNAIKFTRERDQARIEIGYRMDGSTLVCFVKDNGVGFNMKYMNKLFGVFQRLHSADQFEGTGVGLSIVRRIVERHGGKVWVDGQQDQGATFFFSLPDSPS